MKKKLLSIAVLSVLLGVMLITSCKKTTNSTPPTITMLGTNPMNIYLQSGATDPGATAVDNSGNILTPTTNWSSTNPNQNLTGTYTITYIATDANGNSKSTLRTVNVLNAATFLTGIYNVTDVVTGDTTGTRNSTDTVTTSTTVNNVIYISNINGFGPAVKATATHSDTILVFATQYLSGSSFRIQGGGKTNTTGILSTSTTCTRGSTFTETDSCSNTRLARKIR